MYDYKPESGILPMCNGDNMFWKISIVAVKISKAKIPNVHFISISLFTLMLTVSTKLEERKATKDLSMFNKEIYC